VHPITEKFEDALHRSHTVVTKCEVLDSNYVLVDTLKPYEGNVNVDRRAAIRRQCTVRLADPTGAMTPSDFEDILHPLANNRLRLFRGIKFDDGTEEIVSIGVFDIFDTNVFDAKENPYVEVKGYDLSKSVQRARLLNNYHVPAGERYDLAIRDLLSFRVPTLQFNIPQIDFFSPPLVFGASGDQGGGDPWKYASDMAESVGHDIYFDIQGVVNMSPIPNPTIDPVVWTYEEGPLSMLLHVEKRLSKEDVFSRVVAVGENTDLDEPVRANAIDDDPTSPTYIYGPFGDVPFFLRSEYIETEAQAQEVAEAKLRQSRGTSEGLRVMTTSNPAHEVGDVIRVIRGRGKIDNTFIIDKFNVQLDVSQANNMTLRRVA